MSNKNRGLAIIFNHMTFDSSLNLKRRAGTDLDVKTLSETLNNLKFDVSIYEDQSCDQIKSIIEDSSKTVDHTDNDCILIAVLSHGEHGYISAKDKSYQIDMLWSGFTAEKCPSLAGKPKLFFIQACQGNKMDDGFNMGNLRRSQTDGSSSKSYKIPRYADFLVAHSTMSGYGAWRHPTSGSWFIQTLCKELNENGQCCDIERLMTMVRRKVAFDFESEVTKHKQIPTTTSTLTRMLTFT